MTKQQRDAIVASGGVGWNGERLNRALGFDVDGDSAAVAALLHNATQLEDPELIPTILWVADGRTGDHDVVPDLVSLLRARWHEGHEELAHYIQQHRDARAIDALYEAVLAPPDYLVESDNLHPMTRKCIWALADIGTEDAKKKLVSLAAVADETTAGYAQRRLDRWEAERDRKGQRAT